MISGVYLLKKAGEVVYVGQSINVAKRLSQHRSNKVDFDEHEIIETPVSDLKKVEQRYILEHRPKLNGAINKFGQQVFFDSSGEARPPGQRMRERRARMLELGLKPRDFYVTDAEHEYLMSCLKTLRAPFNQSSEHRE